MNFLEMIIISETSLGINRATHKRLEDRCRKGQTYDELLNELLDLPAFTEDEIMLIHAVIDSPLQSDDIEHIRSVAESIYQKLLNR